MLECLCRKTPQADITSSRCDQRHQSQEKQGGRDAHGLMFSGLFTVAFSFSLLGKAFQLLAPASTPVLQAVRQRPSHLLENGHHLGRGQPPVHLPAEHAGSPGDDRLALGLLHQPQRCRLPHQVRPSTAPGQLVPGSCFPSLLM